MNQARFIVARLNEEEREANREKESLARFEKRPGDWTRFMCDPLLGPFGGQSPTRDIATGLYVGRLTDPHRVLREVAAKRAILARHKQAPGVGDRPFCCWCSSDVDTPGLDVWWPCPDVRDITAIWDGHPDYDPAWGPLPVAAH